MRILLLSLLSFLIIMEACRTAETPEKTADAGPVIDTAAVISTGMNISMTTFSHLSKELQAALQEGGVRQAVPYCQLNAFPIADSLSEVYGVLIKRVTDRPRNPADSLNELEANIFQEYRSEKEAGQELSPKVAVVDGGAHYFAPIMLQEFCLKCHGDAGTDILPEDLALIKELYPDDKATGYRPGQLRGMWSIYFPPSSLPSSK